MTLAILALILAPSIIVFVIGCALAVTRSLPPRPRMTRRAKTRAGAV
jgi:hypothetical protein